MSTTQESTEAVLSANMFGRRQIFATVEEITADNVIQEVNSALAYHVQNISEEEYLYWYRRGVQPILRRTKERNTFICNKIIENHAAEVVAFKNGYFLTQPAFYVTRSNGKQSKIDKLNEFLFRSGKQEADNALVDWFHTVGKAALYVEPNNDDEQPVKAYALDPRSAFVVYSLKPGNEPLYGVYIVVQKEHVSIDVFTKDKVYRLLGGSTGNTLTTPYPHYETISYELEKVESNPLGEIPIIEYQYNSVNMSAFESVIWLMDSLNSIQSNRVDGIEQFIQSLIVAVNCQFDEDVTASRIREAGMVLLKSVGENKADFKILTEQLDQGQTQTLVDNIYDQILRICCMPSTRKGGASTSDTGTAVYLRDGFEQADSDARNTEDLFKRSNRQFDKIFLKILTTKGLIKNVTLNDFQLLFVRNNSSNMQTKAQAMQTLIAAGLHPEIALERSGVSNDPVRDFKKSEKYMDMVIGNPDKEEDKENKGDKSNAQEIDPGQEERESVPEEIGKEGRSEELEREEGSEEIGSTEEEREETEEVRKNK